MKISHGFAQNGDRKQPGFCRRNDFTPLPSKHLLLSQDALKCFTSVELEKLKLSILSRIGINQAQINMNTFRATTFTHFPDLPFELRLKVWRLITPGPRTVPIEYRMKYEDFNGKRISKFSGWSTGEPVPVILQICHEARFQARKSLQPAFKSFFHEARIYINFDIDTILFGARLDDPHSIDLFIDDGSSDYVLEIFLGGEHYGADDVENVQRMVLDVSELSGLEWVGMDYSTATYSQLMEPNCYFQGSTNLRSLLHLLVDCPQLSSLQEEFCS